MLSPEGFKNLGRQHEMRRLMVNTPEKPEIDSKIDNAPQSKLLTLVKAINTARQKIRGSR